MWCHFQTQVTKRLWLRLGTPSVSLAGSDRSQLPCVSCPWRSSHGKERTGSLANGHQRTEALSPEAQEELNPSNTMWVSLEVDPSQVQPPKRPQCLLAPWCMQSCEGFRFRGKEIVHAQILNPQKLWDINSCHLLWKTWTCTVLYGKHNSIFKN